MFANLARIAVLAVFVGSTALAQERSVVTVPVSVPLSVLERHVDIALGGQVLHRGEQSRTCVKPQEVCTKIPEFRGFKIYSRMECVQVTPAVGCTIAHQAERVGPLRLGGDSGALQVSQTIRASATIKGRGEIGRHIRETVNASANFTVTARPTVAPDWSVRIPSLDVRYAWRERPNVRLFDLITITFGDEARSALDRTIARYQQDDLSGVLEKIDLKRLVTPVWDALQDPIRVDLSNDVALFVHFRPEAIGLDGPTFSGGRAEATVAIEGLLAASDREDSPFADGPSVLPNLGRVPDDKTFSLVLPVEVSLPTLETALAAQLPQTFETEGAVSGSVEVREASLSEADGFVQLTLNVLAKADTGTFLAPSYEGLVAVAAVPVFDPNTHVLRFTDVSVSIGGSGITATLLRQVLNTQAVASLLQNAAQLNVAREIEKLDAALVDALNRDLAPDLRMEGEAAMSLHDVALSDGLKLSARATGNIRIVGTELHANN